MEVAFEFIDKTDLEPNSVVAILEHAKKRAAIEPLRRQRKLNGRSLLIGRDSAAERARAVLHDLQNHLIGDEPSPLSERIDAVLEILEHPDFPSRQGANPPFRRRPSQLNASDPRYVDYYGRPWAKNWEKHFEQGFGKSRSLKCRPQFSIFSNEGGASVGAVYDRALP
jgi:hypothetical protein